MNFSEKWDKEENSKYINQKLAAKIKKTLSKINFCNHKYPLLGISTIEIRFFGLEIRIQRLEFVECEICGFHWSRK